MAAIEFHELTKDYGDVRAVDSLSFSVEPGEIFGFLGPNGAGKTTTIRTLFGLCTPTDGTATVLGADVRSEPDLIAAKHRIGYLPDSLGFDEEVTGRRILDFYASLRGDARRDELLELFTPPLDRPVREYSAGNRRMLGIVQAFMHDPDLVIMDEPTTGLDPLKQERLHGFLEAERDRGTTVFFSSHVLGEVQRVCDRVGILRDGTLVTLEEVDDLVSRGGKRVRVHVRDGDGLDRFLTDEMIDVDRIGETVGFTYTGSHDALIAHLGGFEIVDFDVRDPPLEDVFMHYYGDGERGGIDTSERVEAEVPDA